MITGPVAFDPNDVRPLPDGRLQIPVTFTENGEQTKRMFNVSNVDDPGAEIGAIIKAENAREQRAIDAKARMVKQPTAIDITPDAVVEPSPEAFEE